MGLHGCANLRGDVAHCMCRFGSSASRFMRVLIGVGNKLWRGWLAVRRSRGSVFQTGSPFRRGDRGFKNPRLLRDRPTDGAAWVASKVHARTWRIVCAGLAAVRAGLCGFNRRWVQVVARMFDRAKVTRVSLSDWLALRARIRGSKDPRLLRDRPTDGAASACKFMRV